MISPTALHEPAFIAAVILLLMATSRSCSSAMPTPAAFTFATSWSSAGPVSSSASTAAAHGVMIASFLFASRSLCQPSKLPSCSLAVSSTNRASTRSTNFVCCFKARKMAPLLFSELRYWPTSNSTRWDS